MKPQVEGSELIHQIPDFDHLLIDLPNTIPILGVPKGGSDRSKVKVTFCVSKITLFSQRTSSDVRDSEEIQNAPEQCKYFSKDTLNTNFVNFDDNWFQEEKLWRSLSRKHCQVQRALSR